MKISKKQQEEIDFFSQQHNPPFTPTDDEIKEYLEVTTLGIKNKSYGNGLGGIPRLIAAKRSFDITIKMWREDLVKGMLSANELREDFKDYPYGVRLVDSVINGITKEYRNRILTESIKKGEAITALAYTNFPKVMETIENYG